MATQDPIRPNLAFLMVDQLPAKWLEAAQSGACPTPKIDCLLEWILMQDQPTSRRELFAPGVQ